MKIKVILHLAILALISCVNYKDKSSIDDVSAIGNNLYLERYEVYGGGVFSGDVLSYYVTDSINFRKYIGSTKSDDERIIIKYTRTQLRIVKYKNAYNERPDTTQVSFESISNLIEEKIWE